MCLKETDMKFSIRNKDRKVSKKEMNALLEKFFQPGNSLWQKTYVEEAWGTLLQRVKEDYWKKLLWGIWQITWTVGFNFLFLSLVLVLLFFFFLMTTRKNTLPSSGILIWSWATHPWPGLLSSYLSKTNPYIPKLWVTNILEFNFILLFFLHICFIK